jgi:hypothetical protein
MIKINELNVSPPSSASATQTRVESAHAAAIARSVIIIVPITLGRATAAARNLNDWHDRAHIRVVVLQRQK